METQDRAGHPMEQVLKLKLNDQIEWWAILNPNSRVNLALLAHQLKFMYGGKLPAVQLPREDQELVPESMTRECVAQASFR